MSPEQCRAARAWLDWSQKDLSARSKVSVSALKDFEKGGTRKTNASTLAAISRAFEDAGIRLLSEGDRATGLEIVEK